MAQIIKDQQDPFHDNFYICSNCHTFLFAANAYYKPVKIEQKPIAKIVFEISENKSIPHLCPKCLESLDFPNDMEIQLHIIDTSDT